MTTFLVLFQMSDNGQNVFIGCFTDFDDLNTCCHCDHVYYVTGIKNGYAFSTINYTCP